MDNTSHNEDRSCKVLRWQKIKSTLNNISVDELTLALKKDPDAIILDVRTPIEYEADHLENAVNFNYLSRTLSEDIDLLDPQKSYYIYCKTGRRSLRVCTLLKNAGFKQVFNIDKGIELVF